MSKKKEINKEHKNAPEEGDEVVIIEEEVQKVKEEKPQPKITKPASASPLPRVLMAIDMFVKLNSDVRNYTLLAGFEHQERKHKRVRDTKENYAARLEEFKTK